MAAILRALNKARNYIAAHPQQAAKIIAEKKYSSITDVSLATKLFKDYDYKVQDNEDASIKSDVQYFTDQLKDIGFLKTNDTTKLADTIYQKIDL